MKRIACATSLYMLINESCILFYSYFSLCGAYAVASYSIFVSCVAGLIFSDKMQTNINITLYYYNFLKRSQVTSHENVQNSTQQLLHMKKSRKVCGNMKGHFCRKLGYFCLAER